MALGVTIFERALKGDPEAVFERLSRCELLSEEGLASRTEIVALIERCREKYGSFIGPSYVHTVARHLLEEGLANEKAAAIHELGLHYDVDLIQNPGAAALLEDIQSG